MWESGAPWMFGSCLNINLSFRKHYCLTKHKFLWMIKAMLNNFDSTERIVFLSPPSSESFPKVTLKIPRIPWELIPLFGGRIPTSTKTEGSHNATVFPVECYCYCQPGWLPLGRHPPPHPPTLHCQHNTVCCILPMKACYCFRSLWPCDREPRPR